MKMKMKIRVTAADPAERATPLFGITTKILTEKYVRLPVKMCHWPGLRVKVNSKADREEERETEKDIC